MTGEELLLVAVVAMAEGHIEAGQRYEDRVLALLPRHDGILERRVRDASGAEEVHLIRFRERAGYEAFMVDPDRLALRADLGDAAPTTRVVEVQDVP